MNELEQLKAEYIAKLKQVKLAEAGISIDEVDTYTRYIDAEDEAEIEKQAQKVVADIEGSSKPDEKWNPFEKGTIE